MYSARTTGVDDSLPWIMRVGTRMFASSEVTSNPAMAEKQDFVTCRGVFINFNTASSRSKSLRSEYREMYVFRNERYETSIRIFDNESSSLVPAEKAGLAAVSIRTNLSTIS